MIIKIWQYEKRLEGAAGGSVRQNLAFDTSLSTGRYIFGLQTYEDFAALRDQVTKVGDYVADADRAPDRVAGRYAYNLNADEPEDQIDELAVSAAAAGLKRFWHVVVSHRPGETLTDEQLEEIRLTIAQVLGVDGCPMLWATHEDKAHLHEHGLIVSYLADTNEAVAFGEGWWKEKAQVAIAICEHRLGLEPEPNRRYVADDSGVYHLLSATKVADADGKLVLGRTELRTIQREHDAFVRQNDALDGYEPGSPWPLQRAAERLAGPLISNSKSWTEVHERLAAIGMRYVRIGATAVLEAADCSGRWDQTDGMRTAAGSAYANAVLGKLSKRLRKEYSPPPPDLHVRAFVMPRYNAPEGAAAADKPVRNEELSEFKALKEALETEYSVTYKEKLTTEKGKGANTSRAKRKAAHQAELQAVKLQRRQIVTPSQVNAANRSPTPPLSSNEVCAFVWGESAQGSAATELHRRQREALEPYYRIEPGRKETRYYLGAQLAIIERARTIQLLAVHRMARIHALMLARARFRQIRIVARQKLREALARIAAELEIKLLPQRLSDVVAAHRMTVKREPGYGIVERAGRWGQLEGKLAKLRSATRSDRNARARAATSFNQETIADFRKRNDDNLNAPWRPNPPPDITLDALRTLNRIDRARLHLVRSRFNVDGARFLDDPVLLDAFAGQARKIVLPDVQSRLEAIEAIQIEQRRWVAAAVLNGRVSIQSDVLTTTRKNDQWAEAFWEAQKVDPSFTRLLAVSQLRPDRFAFNLEERPDVRAWKATRARGDERLIGAMAEEIFAASVKYGDAVAKDARDRNIVAPPKSADVAWSYRHELFEAMGYDDAEALRRTKGRFADAYRGHAYCKPDESDREWDKRKSAYARNFAPQSGQYRS